MTKRLVMILGHLYFRDEEYYIPRDLFEKKGYEITTACSRPVAKSKLGKTVRVDLLTEDLDDDYDALILVGGNGALEYLTNDKVKYLADRFYTKGKIVAAICAAPSILAAAGVLEGKKATCFSDQERFLKEHGALVTKKSVEQDGNIITANGPRGFSGFCKKDHKCT